MKMQRIWCILFVCMQLLHFKQNIAVAIDATSMTTLSNITTTIATVTSSNARTIVRPTQTISSKIIYDMESEDAEVVEARILPIAITTALPFTTSATDQIKPRDKENPRNGRQLFYDPNLFFYHNFHQMEGAKCLTARGMPGTCVRITNCREFFGVGQPLSYFTLRQWPQESSIGFENGLCTFYDAYGRGNSGICCTQGYESGFGMWPPSLVPVQPLPAPPSAAVPKPMQPPQGDADDAENDVEPGMNPNNEFEIDDSSENSPDFLDENNTIYDPVHEEDNKADTPTPVTYEDYRYQWPSQFTGHFSGQWPPPLPTHPPSISNWPPPIPTHPPNHNYPTHPPSSSSGTRPTTQTTKKPITTTTTRRPTTVSTTTRRPSYPGFPSYPSYPAYPSYPTYRPVTTTTTTRKPVTVPTTGGDATNALGLPQKCGIKNPVSPDQERIVGGINASPYEFPWIAVLFRAGKQFCGGTLITPNHILTAAHCVSRFSSWDVAALTAHLGDYNIRTDFEVKHVERRIKRLVRHKGFDFSHLHNDIAILTLNEPVKFTYEIQPICLPTSTVQQGRSYSGQVATVAGWGSLRENGPQPSVLQKVQIPIWSNTDCARKYGRAAPGGIIESMICAGQTAKDSCSGDSGGPLIINEGGRYTQVGIVSWGIGCGKGQYPGVYTRITSLLPWIYKNIKM